MRAVVCHEFASIQTLSVEDCEIPQPSVGQVLIRVAAAGVNFYDTLIVQGLYQIKPPLPFSPGGEVAGIVESCGEGVTGFKPGDRIMAFMSFGGYAEYVVAPHTQCWHLSKGLEFKTAAAGLVTCGTAWFGLMDIAELSAGESVLVLGAAGGVGLAAIQIAVEAGGKVIAAAGHDRKLELCRQAGAQQTINYRDDCFRQRLRDLAPDGIDVVVDMVGGEIAETVLRAMAWRGRYLVIGFASGEIPRFPAHLVLLKGCNVIGVLWDGLLRWEVENARIQIEQLVSRWRQGKLMPSHVVEWKLDQASQLLTSVANREVEGKQVLIFGNMT